MSRYLMISRLRWPALLLLTGVIALLHQAHILSWGHAWPLYLILLGVLALAERAAMASEPVPAYPYDYPAAGYAPPAGYAAGYGAAPVGPAPVAPVASEIVPANTQFAADANPSAGTLTNEHGTWKEEGR